MMRFLTTQCREMLCPRIPFQMIHFRKTRFQMILFRKSRFQMILFRKTRVRRILNQRTLPQAANCRGLQSQYLRLLSHRCHMSGLFPLT